MSLLSASFLQAEKLDQCDEFRLPPDAFLQTLYLGQSATSNWRLELVQ